MSSAVAASSAVNGHGPVQTSKLSKGQLKKLKAKQKKDQEPQPKSSSAAVGDVKANGTSDEAKQVSEEPGSSSAQQNDPVVKVEEAQAGSTGSNGIGAGGSGNMYDDMEDQDTKPSTSQLAEASGVDEIPPEFAAIFAKFQDPDAAQGSGGQAVDEETGKGHVYYSDDEVLSEDEEAAARAEELSKRKQKKLSRLSVAELKRLVKRPDVVEWVDVTALDPRLLIHLKSYKNTIGIPAHWSAKRDYLASKKGIEKPPFQLPAWIADTGIATQRDAIKEKEAEQSLKQKTRERVQPKMGKIDIDYQKLHDAFFKFQEKPPLSDFGEMYYEGKEYETHLKEKKPGELSKELKEALSIPPLAPPPWLIAMQRFGPPPSYPNLKIPGLNAPIPEGAQWGFHPGGWGKPPVDEFNRPLYGDVFGVSMPGDQDPDAFIDKGRWGELDPDVEESDEEEEEEEEEEDDEEGAPPEGLQTPSSFAQGMETPSGFASVASTVPGGLETPDYLELRKRRETTEDTDAGGPPRQLYQVLPEQRANIKGLLGSERSYDTRNIGTGNVPILGVDDRGQKRKADGVDVSIDAAELDGMSEAELRQRFEHAKRTSSGAGQGGREDFSEFVAEEAAKRRQKADTRDKKRKQDNFKF